MISQKELDALRKYIEANLEVEDDGIDICSVSACSINNSLEEYLKNPEKTFRERLFEIIDERQLSGPEVYKNFISRQVYSKIQCDADYRPTKATAIALCISLKLSVEEADDLLSRAGFALSACSIQDLIIKYCLKEKIYDLIDINEYLYNNNFPLFKFTTNFACRRRTCAAPRWR